MSTTQSVDDPESFEHRFTTTNGIRLHYVEQGKGPLVLLIHGFPYIWYEWRHQIRTLADAGYRAVAPDLRGYGQSDAPTDVAQYDNFQVVGDLVALIHGLGEYSAVIVGHDIGSKIAYNAVELRPDLFGGLVLVNGAGGPRAAISPSVLFAQMQAASGRRFYIDHFQEPGIADAEFNADIYKSLRSALYTVSGSVSEDKRWPASVGNGETILDTLVNPKELPAWLSDQALDYYVAEYKRHGFTPPLNYYRNIARSWEMTVFLNDLKPALPSFYIGGDVDPSNSFNKPAFDVLENSLPNLRGKVVLEGVGHDSAEEKPDVFNKHLLEFLESL